ncbi:hypothetical protein Tco_1422055 [Tanacetum coccineum]
MACDLTVYVHACKEHRVIYNAPFTLTECWKVLRDHKKWKEAEIPWFLKKSNEAVDSEDVEILEVQPLGRDRSKKKPYTARSESSSAGEPGLVEALLIKWKKGAAIATRTT